MIMSKGRCRIVVSTYGMDDTSSAIDKATVITKKQGINHPQTIPTWPPVPCQRGKRQNYSGNIPETRGNEKVEVTDATTPIMENAKAMVSIN